MHKYTRIMNKVYHVLLVSIHIACKILLSYTSTLKTYRVDTEDKVLESFKDITLAMIKVVIHDTEVLQ